MGLLLPKTERKSTSQYQLFLWPKNARKNIICPDFSRLWPKKELKLKDSDLGKLLLKNARKYIIQYLLLLGPKMGENPNFWPLSRLVLRM